jgi:hypothetical protein
MRTSGQALAVTVAPRTREGHSDTRPPRTRSASNYAAEHTQSASR